VTRQQFNLQSDPRSPNSCVAEVNAATYLLTYLLTSTAEVQNAHTIALCLVTVATLPFPRREAEKNEWSYTSTAPIRLHGVVLR